MVLTSRFNVSVFQSDVGAAAVRGRRSGRGSVLDGSDNDSGGSPSADAEDRPTGQAVDKVCLTQNVHRQTKHRLWSVVVLCHHSL